MSKHKNIDKINNIYIMSAIVYIQYISLNCILVSKIQENSMQLIELYIKCKENFILYNRIVLKMQLRRISKMTNMIILQEMVLNVIKRIMQLSVMHLAGLYIFCVHLSVFCIYMELIEQDYAVFLYVFYRINLLFRMHLT